MGSASKPSSSSQLASACRRKSCPFRPLALVRSGEPLRDKPPCPNFKKGFKRSVNVVRKSLKTRTF
eukprot:2143917-Amphidinium_carterae.1